MSSLYVLLLRFGFINFIGTGFPEIHQLPHGGIAHRFHGGAVFKPFNCRNALKAQGMVGIISENLATFLLDFYAFLLTIIYISEKNQRKIIRMAKS